ncbi:MAG: hypothetical protein JSW34_07210 [Candidatus Zixiibacteriota bacterium]|nr:MAG: hypothetical protein JSW34_07210 [candidate division Zixibacteria bacterium]
MYKRAGVLKAGAIFVLLVFLQALVLPEFVQAQTPECPFDKDNPSIENARYNFKITNYDCAEVELKTLLADENLDLQIKADAHVLLAAVYYAKIRDDEQKQDLVIEQFVAAFKAFRNWRGDLDIKSPEFVAMMEQAQVLVDKQDDALEAATDKVKEELPDEEAEEVVQVVPVSGDGKKPWYKQWWAIGLGVGLVAGAVVLAAGGGGDEAPPDNDLPGFPPTP